jgi:hypothetical protein
MALAHECGENKETRFTVNNLDIAYCTTLPALCMVRLEKFEAMHRRSGCAGADGCGLVVKLCEQRKWNLSDHNTQYVAYHPNGPRFSSQDDLERKKGL